ncbi:MAG: hypothetical protein K6A82_05045 [Prevotella sp.]|nr:hypothetical protein [Prevotella sp.]
MRLIDENPDKAIITTKFVANERKAIIKVVYDEDGDWQFYSNDDIDEGDAVVLSVRQILEIDDTLASLELSKGQEVVRNDMNSGEWQVN